MKRVFAGSFTAVIFSISYVECSWIRLSLLCLCIVNLRALHRQMYEHSMYYIIFRQMFYNKNPEES